MNVSQPLLLLHQNNKMMMMMMIIDTGYYLNTIHSSWNTEIIFDQEYEKKY